MADPYASSMLTKVAFGETRRRPAPERWGCTNLWATPIVADPLVVEHHYGPGGAMPEHTGAEAVLCMCVGGRGFVNVGDETADLGALEAVVWPAGETHRLWTTDSSMTVLLVHFPGRTDLTPPSEQVATGAG
jgi:quercetin dioxygenase-like cupin family protein